MFDEKLVYGFNCRNIIAWETGIRAVIICITLNILINLQYTADWYSALIMTLATLQGKDRYPYPVGYQAVRAQNGTTYKMEIHEGVNGPRFLVCSLASLCLTCFDSIY